MNKLSARLMPTLGLMTLLAGCAMANSSPVVVSDCARLTVQPYTRAEQARVAQEMADDPSPGRDAMIGDYGRSRAEIRACKKVST